MRVLYGDAVRIITPEKASTDRVGGLWQELRRKADGEFNNFEDFLFLPLSNFVPDLKYNSEVKYVVLTGIGGSSLGPKAVYDALFGYYDAVEPERFPKLYILENVDSAYAGSLMNLLSKTSNPREIAFVITCKSGKTFETTKNLEFISSEKYPHLMNGENTYVVSVEGNHTWEWGKQLGARLFPMPQIVSGRFSVFSGVGVVPLGLANIDTYKFIEGAKLSIKNAEDPQTTAALRYGLFGKGWDSDVYFAFDGRLESLAEWMCSITAESLGKNGAGITPIASMGSRDLHSIGQLYLQGVRNKFTTFLSLSDSDPDNLFILEAVKKAYDDAQLPYMHVVLESENAETLTRELGFFMQSKIIETVLLGRLMGLNPYDQPGVELYKKYLQ